MTDREELLAAQRRAYNDWKGGRLGKPLLAGRCIADDGRCRRVMLNIYGTLDDRLFLADAWFRPGTRYVRTIVANGESMPLLNLNPLPVFRLLDDRLADDARGGVTVSCPEHYSIPVSFAMLAEAVARGYREILLHPTMYDRVSRGDV